MVDEEGNIGAVGGNVRYRVFSINVSAKENIKFELCDTLESNDYMTYGGFVIQFEDTETLTGSMNEEDANASSPLAGVKMEVTECSDTSVTIRITNDTEKYIDCVTDFYLEIYDEKAGDWWEIDTIIDDVAFDMVAYKIQKDSPYEKVIDFEQSYGKLEPGRYRIVKTVTDFRGTGDYTDYTYTAEFCIKEVKITRKQQQGVFQRNPVKS